MNTSACKMQRPLCFEYNMFPAGAQHKDSSMMFEMRKDYALKSSGHVSNMLSKCTFPSHLALQRANIIDRTCRLCLDKLRCFWCISPAHADPKMLAQEIHGFIERNRGYVVEGG